MFEKIHKMFGSKKTVKKAKEPHYSHVEPCAFGSGSVDTYIEKRFNPMVEWYDKKSAWAKQRYLRVQATTVVGGALVPVLINLRDFEMAELNMAVQGITTVISILVVILVALEGVLHFREQWVNYRSTEQYMRREYYLFFAGEGPYAQVQPGDEDRALRTFVERIEAALSAESASTLQILTSTSDASASETKHTPPVPRETPQEEGAPPPTTGDGNVIGDGDGDVNGDS